ncbi:hypothetical protein QWY82_12725 [Simiduia curdlanivorans]|uniref:Uncharacterized protein n=1 Tax=Simiduia curdlanivorans TaxID=1492769 RepID=A0ABV8V7W9_9GAMM|nr:hypothetical protein [Simiduia curdlanivorans]MDN3639661.1 hypothetical protein [Simiduia curdlanivorans]
MSATAPSRNSPLFVERRKGNRRVEQDRCANLDLDLYHRKRRTQRDRRTAQRSKIEDITAFYEAQMAALEAPIQ